MMRSWTMPLFTALALALVPALGGARGADDLRLEVAGHVIRAELALTPAQRSRGLMLRRHLKPDHGMLFVLDRPQVMCMWMKDTFLPLSVAFLDAKGVITRISDMQPQSLELHCSGQNTLYALEMEQGWFRQRGIGAGDRVQGLTGLQGR